jgi:hypothetical protein
MKEPPAVTLFTPPCDFHHKFRVIRGKISKGANTFSCLSYDLTLERDRSFGRSRGIRRRARGQAGCGKRLDFPRSAQENVPRRLKPIDFIDLLGTAEAVLFQNGSNMEFFRGL